MFPQHDCNIGKKGEKTGCKNCSCSAFRFIPRRPEEVGMDWLPRRKGFNVHTWRPSCKCKHTHEDHKASMPFKCNACSCYTFESDFVCIGCDRSFEDHQTLYEFESERMQLKKTVREAFRPLANDPEI